MREYMAGPAPGGAPEAPLAALTAPQAVAAALLHTQFCSTRPVPQMDSSSGHFWENWVINSHSLSLLPLLSALFSLLSHGKRVARTGRKMPSQVLLAAGLGCTRAHAADVCARNTRWVSRTEGVLLEIPVGFMSVGVQCFSVAKVFRVARPRANSAGAVFRWYIAVVKLLHREPVARVLCYFRGIVVEMRCGGRRPFFHLVSVILLCFIV